MTSGVLVSTKPFATARTSQHLQSSAPVKCLQNCQCSLWPLLNWPAGVGWSVFLSPKHRDTRYYQHTSDLPAWIFLSVKITLWEERRRGQLLTWHSWSPVCYVLFLYSWKEPSQIYKWCHKYKHWMHSHIKHFCSWIISLTFGPNVNTKLQY